MVNQSFGNLHQFLMMGGFGDYVWSAYGVTLLVLAWLIFGTFRMRRKTKRLKTQD